VPLTEVPVGATAEIVSIAADNEQTKFLAAELLVPGAVVTVQGAGSSGVLIETEGRWVHLSAVIAGSVEAVEGKPHAPE